MLGLGTLAKKVFGTANDRVIKSVQPLVGRINALEPEFQALSDDDFKAKTAEFRDRISNGESLDDLLPEAFACAREASVRALGLRPFDVQLIGAIFLHQGNISEMKTGEGKTLTAVLAVYLNALTGRGVHVVTVNDYLAKRDAEWMGKVYEFLGISVGYIIPGMEFADKKAAYEADVTYATNNELGFDYLRDNIRDNLSQMVQRDHYFAIVDEVDSILIDEARTPLIISGPAEDKSDLYNKIDELIPRIGEEHYELDEKNKVAHLTDEGIEAIEGMLVEAELLAEGTSLYDPENTSVVHHVNQALAAHKLFKRDKDYISRNGEIVLIDEFTGRMMAGRRLSHGLHQAIEAKEGVAIQPENVTFAQVTYQNYFRLYDKLAGMTGTAMTEAEEFMDIYGLGVIEVPTNVAVTRIDEDDRVYSSANEKYTAVIEEIKATHAKGQPLLIGTTSIEKSEMLSGLLKKSGIKHNVLNARFHEQEAEIIGAAGIPGAVTIATNMAGRGTDIQLGGNVEMKVQKALSEAEHPDPAQLRADIEANVAADKQKALDAGGLCVIGTERHESRRIDNQLRGRSGRQGDPGRTIFFLSFQDDLMRIFGSERIDSMLKRLGMKEGEAIIHPWVNKSLERAQAKVEGFNFDVRKQLLKYDDVMNEQRKVIFAQRLDIMKADDLSETVREMRHDVIDDTVSRHIPPKAYADQWDTEGLQEEIKRVFALDLPISDWAAEEGVDEEAIIERLESETDKSAAQKVAAHGAPVIRRIEKQVLLQAIDKSWREHLLRLEHLRAVVGFRGYAQRDPLNEYKSEAFTMFESLLSRLRQDVSIQLSHVQIMTQEQQEQMLAQLRAAAEAQAKAKEQAEAASQESATGGAAGSAKGVDPDDPSTWSKAGRNDPCPCGSGKKFKHCHGRA